MYKYKFYDFHQLRVEMESDEGQVLLCCVESHRDTSRRIALNLRWLSQLSEQSAPMHAQQLIPAIPAHRCRQHFARASFRAKASFQTGSSSRVRFVPAPKRYDSALRRRQPHWLQQHASPERALALAPSQQ